MRVASGVQREALCQRFGESLKAKNVEAHRIDEAVNRLRKCQAKVQPAARAGAAAGPAPPYTDVLPADGDVESFVLFDLVHVSTSDKKFTGQAWGISVPGAGGFAGAVGCISDAQTLYSNTTGFFFLIDDVELTVTLLDSNNIPLGVFEGFGVSTGVTGAGAGSGSWA